MPYARAARPCGSFRCRGRREDCQIASGYTFDACALIDLVDEGLDLLGGVVTALGVVVVASSVLAEVEVLSREAAETLGIRIHDPTDAQLDLAAAGSGSLSFADRVCLIVAAELGLVCVTGDARLARACAEGMVERWTTLRPMIEMVRLGALDPADCLARARAIRGRNTFITTQVFQMFEVELRTAARRRRRP